MSGHTFKFHWTVQNLKYFDLVGIAFRSERLIMDLGVNQLIITDSIIIVFVIIIHD